MYALNYARDDHSPQHLEILTLLIHAGAYFDTTKPDQLCAFLITCRSTKPHDIYARNIVNMVLPTKFENQAPENDEWLFIFRVVKHLLQHNALLPSTCTGMMKQHAPVFCNTRRMYN